MPELAFQSDELNLPDHEKAAARHDYMSDVPNATAQELLAVLRRNGYRTDGVLEAARLLPLEEYREVEAVYTGLPEQPHGKIRRRRR